MMDVEEDLFAGFDLDEMKALEDGDLSIFSNFIDANFRLQLPNGSLTESDPSPQSTTPASSEELAMGNGLEEEDPQDHKHLLNLFDQHLNPAFNNNAELFPNNNNYTPTSAPKAKGAEAASKNPPEDPAAPPPLVVCPIEVGKTSITLQKNQLCACKECGKLFKSIWYLKQHAVRHSNERPFKCNFCQKAFKFRSNLYQHNCSSRSERMRQRGSNAPLRHLQPSHPMSPTNKKRFYTRGIAYTEMYGGGQMGAVNEMGANQLPLNPAGQQSLLYGQQMGMTGGSIFPNNPGGNGEMQNMDAAYQNYGGPMGLDGQMMGGFEQQPMIENNSIRHKPLDPTYVDAYLQKNRHRIYSCRKCKLQFPHREYLQRHNAWHNDLDNRPFGCDQCPQRFGTEKQLNSHLQKHAEDSPHRCVHCNGAFRSALALRRHQDQSRQCYRPPPFAVYPPQSLIVSPNAPLDEFAFIDDPPTGFGLNRQKTTDSGVASDSSTHSYNTSPVSNCNEEELEMGLQHAFAPSMDSKKALHEKLKEEEADSGVEFRSRLNSTAQSCSPGSSSFSSDAGSSPARKYSKTSVHNPHEQQLHSHLQTGEYLPVYNPQPAGYNQPAYHPHNTRSSGAAGRSSTGHYSSGVGGWTASGLSTSFLSADYSLGHQFGSREDGVMGLQLAAVGTSNLLSGKLALPTFEAEALDSESELLAELEVFEPFGFRPAGDEEVAVEAREVVEEAVREFLRRLIAVFLNAVLSTKTAAKES